MASVVAVGLVFAPI